ncbi:MAG: hypothetical protein IPN08_17280 [Bacteroidales bacterium]|nr:hypothetical protein [Bacteroidales bacterium]
MPLKAAWESIWTLIDDIDLYNDLLQVNPDLINQVPDIVDRVIAASSSYKY